MMTDDKSSTQVEPGAAAQLTCRSWSFIGMCVRWLSVAVLAALIGTWLVWFSAYVQRKQNEEDIRAACGRVMPETADRCFDTVIIQRGVIRR